MQFGYRVLESAQRRAVDMREFLKPHRRALGRIEHPLRNLNKRCMRRHLRQFVEVHDIRASSARPAGQNAEVVPAVPEIAEPSGLKVDTVGFL